MIAISSILFDPQATRVFRRSRLKNDLLNRMGTRRMSRMGTLDGGVMFYDSGYTDADRTITVYEHNPSLASMEFARYLVSSAGMLTVSAPDGFYIGAAKRFGVTAGELRIDIYVKERVI